jgi:excinuclease ABC subunit C
MTHSLYEKLNIKNIPTSPGVYLMRDAAARIIYIGKASNLRNRITSYFRNDGTYKTNALINSLRHIDFILAASDREAMILEDRLIKAHQPYYNVMLKDGKTYPYLKLTYEDFPRLVFTRRVLKDGGEYFGPYPHVYEMKKIFYWLRHLFQWRYCKHEFSEAKLPKLEKVKSCLYLHTNRCPAPCVGKISSRDYKKQINEISLFLNGKYKSLVKTWEKEMRLASKNMDFEKAKALRDRISALEISNEKVTMREISEQDMVSSFTTNKTLEELKNVLGLSKWPMIIEGFDISNISGTDSVASMVRFHNGKPDKSGYRKFKIRTITGPDDPRMIAETVYRRYRRLKEEKAEMPDLVLIDGGKTQLNAAQKSLEDLKLQLPLISLAKREEEIFTKDSSDPIKLPKDSKPLHLLQAVRDEAHRFAVAYHHKRRQIRLKIQ